MLIALSASQVQSVEPHAQYDLLTVKITSIGDDFPLDRPITVIEAWTKDGLFIGRKEEAESLVDRGLSKFHSTSSKVVNVAFNEREKKWVGWSHRATQYFGEDDVKNSDMLNIRNKAFSIWINDVMDSFIQKKGVLKLFLDKQEEVADFTIVAGDGSITTTVSRRFRDEVILETKLDYAKQLACRFAESMS